MGNQSDDTVLVFTPPLREALRYAEQHRGHRLSEREVVEVRDRSPCIVMERSRADAQSAEEGADFDPEQAWAEYQATDFGVDARHVLCAVGNWKTFEAIDALAERFGFEVDHEFSQLTPDAAMSRAFDVSFDRVSLSVTPEDREAIAAHTAVAYVLSPPVTKKNAGKVALKTLQLVEALFAEGAVGIKNESAGIAHGKERWLELAAGAQSDKAVGAELYFAFVRRPLKSADGVFYTCGLHLLGEADVQISDSLEPFEAVSWLDALALYLVCERPPRGVHPGNTFVRTPTDAKRVMRFLPCREYENDDFFFNPWGYVRLEPSLVPGAPGHQE